LNPPQFDTELQFDVTGQAQPEPTATPAPTQTPEPAQRQSAAVRSGHGELGQVIVLALSLGALVGFGAVRLGRLRAEP
jgi:hypothetical protein